MRKIICLSILFIVQLTLNAQFEDKIINVQKIDNPITVDGALDEKTWSELEIYANDFQQYFPLDSVSAEDQTNIKMCFDDQNLYIAIECYVQSDDYTIPTLRRDYRAGGNDNITLLIDPFNDGTNAFMFGTNPNGVQREGLISGGGNSLNGFDTSWDNKWICETTKHNDRYITEMAIPFSTLRFNKDVQEWRFNSYRFDMQKNERSTWVRIPRNQWIFNLGYMGKMVFSEKIDAKGSKVSLIPYAIASYAEDREEGIDGFGSYNVGGDAKFSITPGLNLDLTINPDFSQVEVDRQVTNLSRFEISFPERRQFFLENADLFGSFGFGNINPFFSRRIGITQDTTTEQNIQNAIYGGFRLSGKLNNDWRIGLLSTFTEREANAGQPDLNHTVATLQRKIGARSNVGFIFVNRESLGEIENNLFDNYNRVIGVDYNLATSDNTWSGKTFLHRSISVNDQEQPYAHGVNLEYSKRKFLARWRHEYVGEGYDAQLGFIRRDDYFNINPEGRYFIYHSDSPINRSSIIFNYNQFWKPELGSTDQQIQLGYELEMLNNDRWRFQFNRRFIFLFDDFDPTGTDSAPLLSETSYTFHFFEADYRSDNSKSFFYRVRPTIGQYFNGWRYGVRGDINYRIEPFGTVSLNYNVNTFDHPHLDGNRSTILLGPRFDISFTKKIFLTAFFQYNSQSENTNINTRLQWRFAPASDFFLVYSDNYFTGNPADPSDRFAVNLRNRSVVAKFTYWLNI